MSSNMCAVCDSEYTAEGSEICPDCKDHVKAGEVHFIEIENGSEQEPVRTGRTWQVKKNLVETTIMEPMRSIILAMGFTYVTEEMAKTLELE